MQTPSISTSPALTSSEVKFEDAKVEAAFQRWVNNKPGYQIDMLSANRQRKFFYKAWLACQATTN